MIRDKYCLCNGGGFTARIEAPLFPMDIEHEGQTNQFFTAAYKCCKCGTLTLRGETNQRVTFNVFTKEITEEQLADLRQQKVQYDLELRKENS